MKTLEYFKPTTLDEAWELKAKNSGARFIAGGTDILVKMKNRVIAPPALISLRSIPELAGIEEGDVTRIGALTTITDIVHHSTLAKKYPVLIEAASRLGSAQIRNAATIGGNLCNCSPCADTALPLLVLDATARLQGPGTQREIPLHKFFQGPGESCLMQNEILTDILLPAPSPTAKATSMKKGRVKMDLAIASVAVLLEMEGPACKTARFAAGSVAPVPLRLKDVETLVTGQPFTKNLLADARNLAMASIAPITDIRSTEEYRRHLIGVYVQRSVETLMGWNSE